MLLYVSSVHLILLCVDESEGHALGVTLFGGGAVSEEVVSVVASTTENTYNTHASTRPGDECRGKSLLLVAQGHICRIHQ
jgi:hypothetical protein